VNKYELALIHYDGDNSKPYCDLVYEALKEKRDREKGCDCCADLKANPADNINFCGNCGRKLVR